uniref:TIR domain-containing protein n=1 Tax=Glycine max TaxID=3847 RepID=A0A0R0FSY0_SOYBN
MAFQVSHKIKYVAFLCLLLARIDNNSSYLVTSFTFLNDTPQIKYDVFVSFRGADIRQGFLSHLIEAFSRKHIAAFVDHNILKGDELSETLLGAINGSLISLIIFSQNYASSRWCLLELVKIVECRKRDGQIVVPVFYKVDPSDVRHQKGTYGDAFAKHEGKFSLTTIQTWRSALNESANLSGFHSSTFGDEAELVKEIVKCVWMRLNHAHQVNSKGLVGVGKRIVHVESLLQLEAADVRIIGIWGIGGIGEEYLKIDTPNGLPQYVERRLHRMKVLIILDDVNDSEQLETLARTDWFGPGSRIIVTTRDRQVLANEFANIYEVEPLNFDESLWLFNLNVFKQKHPEIEYYELSKKVVDYAKGIPFVLKLLGHRLHGKEKEIWESQLEGQNVQTKKVHDIIKLSYNDLDQDEKKILMDIACFFYGLRLEVKRIKLLLKDHDYSVASGLERLKDKALISISKENMVSMHDIIKETAWQIAPQESIEDPRSQIRLFDPDDVYQVLKYNKGNEAIRSIVVNLLRMKQLRLNPQVFTKMNKLHFLNFYSVWSSSTFLQDPWGLYLSQGLESLPNELRYLRWTHYPLESLPSKFSAENLVELHLPYSRVKKLWLKVPDLVNLKVLKLHSSAHVKELPDLSTATNLEIIGLRFCVGLTRVHPSVFSLKKLEKLDLGGCTSLTSLRSNIHMQSLRYLSLHGCLELKDFSVISKNLVKLNLELTSIKQLPLSIGSQSMLKMLRLAYTYIETLPTSIKHLTRLRHLDLRYCAGLRTLPELPPSLETLDVRECVSLETVMFPSIPQQRKENKKKVCFWNCLQLDEYSLMAIEMNAQINMVKFAHQHLSTFRDAQGTYVYPGSDVPQWLDHKTRHGYDDDYVTIAPHSSHLGFIFGFIVPEVPYGGSNLKLKITTGAEGEEGNSIIVYLERPHHGIKSNHVYLMYDQACSHFLNSRAKHHPMLKIKVTVASQTLTSQYVPLQIRGFGVSTINSFPQIEELVYSSSKENSDVYPVSVWNG